MCGPSKCSLNLNSSSGCCPKREPWFPFFENSSYVGYSFLYYETACTLPSTHRCKPRKLKSPANHPRCEEPPTGKCGFADGLITLSSAGFFRMSNAIRHRVAMERIFSAGVSPETAREAAMIVNSAWIQAFSSIHWEYMCLKELPPEGSEENFEESGSRGNNRPFRSKMQT